MLTEIMETGIKVDVKTSIDKRALGKRLETLRINKGIGSVLEAAKLMDIPKTNLYNYESGISIPREAHLKKICEFYDVDTPYLFFGLGHPEHPVMLVTQIPVLDKLPSDYQNRVSEGGAVEYVALPDTPLNSYAVKAKDDSMAPLIREGNYVVFLPDEKINNGDIVVLANEYDEPLTRRYRIKEGKAFLVSDNPEYPKFKLTKDYRIVGRVIDIWSRRKP